MRLEAGWKVKSKSKESLTVTVLRAFNFFFFSHDNKKQESELLRTPYYVESAGSLDVSPASLVIGVDVGRQQAGHARRPLVLSLPSPDTPHKSSFHMSDHHTVSHPLTLASAWCPFATGLW